MAASKLHEPSPAIVHHLAERLRALAHPLRFRLAWTLGQGEMCVQDLHSCFDTCTQSNISQHLAILRTQNLVACRKEGNRVLYRLTDPLVQQWLPLLVSDCHASMKNNLLEQGQPA